jgi:hypothetical protein
MQTDHFLATKRRKNPLANEAFKAPVGARKITAVRRNVFRASLWLMNS